jgi:transposase InsO family protein
LASRSAISNPAIPTRMRLSNGSTKSYRDAVLNAHLLSKLEQVREVTAEWKDTYNEYRLRDALGRIPPAMYMRKLKLDNSGLELYPLRGSLRIHYNTRRQHSSLGYRPPASEVVMPRKREKRWQPVEWLLGLTWNHDQLIHTGHPHILRNERRWSQIGRERHRYRQKQPTWISRNGSDFATDSDRRAAARRGPSVTSDGACQLRPDHRQQ